MASLLRLLNQPWLSEHALSQTLAGKLTSVGQPASLSCRLHNYCIDERQGPPPVVHFEDREELSEFAEDDNGVPLHMRNAGEHFEDITRIIRAQLQLDRFFCIILNVQGPQECQLSDLIGRGFIKRLHGF